MTEKISVLIVDDLRETRENVRKLLQFEPDLVVVDQAENGDDAVAKARQYRPDVVLMDINMPGVDGIGASQTIAKVVPETQIIIMSVQSEADYLRRAMLAGARDFLMKPFSGDELVAAIRRVYETRPVTPVVTAVAARESARRSGQSTAPAQEGKVIAVFSPKGGIGCTTIAVNLAVSMADSNYNTVLVDGSLQFGDVAVMLNLKSSTTIVDLVERMSELDNDLVGSVVAAHGSGLKILLAPPRPEMAELVTEEHIKKLLQTLRQMYDFVIIDTSSSLNDVNLAMLDIADRIVLVTQQNLPSLKNASRFYNLSEGLDYETNKIMLVVNHGSNRLSVSIKDIVDSLKRPVVGVIPEDESAYTAADQGKPLVGGPWQRRPSAAAINQLSQKLVDELMSEEGEGIVESSTASGSRLSRLFGL
ncbi:MAG: response regulator [Candidatus Promineifilaceae bacterium]